MPEVRFVSLRGSYDLILAPRLVWTGQSRPPALLASRVAALEPPSEPLSRDSTLGPEVIVAALVGA